MEILGENVRGAANDVMTRKCQTTKIIMKNTLLPLLALCSSVSATTLAYYDINYIYESAHLKDQAGYANVVATDLVGVGAATATNNLVTPNVTLYNDVRGGQLSSTVAPSSVATVSFTTTGVYAAGPNPDEYYTAAYDSISFYTGTIRSFDYAVSYSIGGVETFISGTSSTDGTAVSTDSFDLVTIDFDNFWSNEEVTWNLYFENTSVYTQTPYFDDITVSGGYVLAPEPTSAALLGLAGITLITRRKRA